MLVLLLRLVITGKGQEVAHPMLPSYQVIVAASS